MYNAHRGMMPQHQAPNNRLTELLEQIRAEFENSQSRVGLSDHEREQISEEPFDPQDRWEVGG